MVKTISEEERRTRKENEEDKSVISVGGLLIDERLVLVHKSFLESIIESKRFSSFVVSEFRRELSKLKGEILL